MIIEFILVLLYDKKTNGFIWMLFNIIIFLILKLWLIFIGIKKI